MAKNRLLIAGEKSNWEVMFFLLVDKMVPFLKPNGDFDRQDIVGDQGMPFVYKTLGACGYEVDKTLEKSLQGTINRMVKKGYILADYGRYTLRQIGYERMCKIREKYSPEKKIFIGELKESLEYFDSLSEAGCKDIIKKQVHPINAYLLL
ncbi:MAG: hypothetical protein HUN05_11895 [Desulfobacter sp.]|nr:MAG: hypothetical protein HUN05_11895 [Desulfobacter sp.]